jgi:hypothetical protein
MNVPHRLRAVLVVLVVVAAASAAQAHHSFSGAFDVSQQATLKGVISKIDWVNPHIYIYLDVKENDGKVTTWALETLPTNHMRSVGLTRQDFWNNASAGEVVTAHVNPARDLTTFRAGWLLRITYADGHFFHLNGDPKAIAEAQ